MHKHRFTGAGRAYDQHVLHTLHGNDQVRAIRETVPNVMPSAPAFSPSGMGAAIFCANAMRVR